jgi:N-acetylglutamate synthase-like GNAT family acetyltransferase
MIVDPARRGSRVGTALLDAALGRCRDLSFVRVYLWTHDQGDWYLRLGWTKVEDKMFRGVPVTIFHIDL